MINNEIIFPTILVFFIIYQGREIKRLKKRIDMLGNERDSNFFSEEDEKEKLKDKQLKKYVIVGVTSVVFIMLLIVIFGKLKYG
jgi:hypothetical protein